MHGTLSPQGESGAHRRRSPHMPSDKSATDQFLKDGRTISVGDCALFKPPQDSPPFIGIIRQLLHTRDHNLQLHVNWLYRPAEVTLGKGILLDAAPNEIFYSFHKDEIPAASLIHPCRVAFLPKGTELPAGISSFVCRRVYDIENKRLWWLTDQDYINERGRWGFEIQTLSKELQEDVKQLLHKTRVEMHATVQPGGRSPKPVNISSSTSQLKPGFDSVQNMTSFPTQVKGKKRERMDQNPDHVKRERFMKPDDGDSGQSRTESNLKSEIAKMTEKGGLVDSEGVEKLVHLMQPVKVVKKMDLLSRSMLAGVIAATDNIDCLNKFVQLRGLPVLDQWLQDIHKGKIGDGSSKDGDNKSVEEFLLVLLCALDKLPVNLHALQMCNIGRSVNHLRSHKNSEIQKKARTLVDTWKKRVEAEMNVIDAKSGSNQTVSWPSKSRLPETHEGNRNSIGSKDIAPRSSVTQLSSSKTFSSKPSPGETTKPTCSSPGLGKSASPPASVKESQPRATVGVASDTPLMPRDDRSSALGHSHNYSQSLSSKETKRLTAGSINISKVSVCASRPHKPNGFPGASVSGDLKETGSSRTFQQRSTTLEKVSHSGSTEKKFLDVPVAEGSNHKLIVKIPKGVRSPAQRESGGFFEDPSIMSSTVASPVLADKHDQFDHNVKDKSDASRASIITNVNTESCHCNDFKDVLTGPHGGDGSPTGPDDEERFTTAGDIREGAEVSRAVSLSFGNEVRYGKLSDASFSSMNALVESCVKYSVANPPMLIDDVGMNLLASVAAGEISKSDVVSPSHSTQRGSPAAEIACTVDGPKSKHSSEYNLIPDGAQPNDEGDGNNMKHVIASGTSWTTNESCQAMQSSPKFYRDGKAGSSCSEQNLALASNSTSTGFQANADRCCESDKLLDESRASPACMNDKKREDEENQPLPIKKTDSSNKLVGVSDAKLGGNGASISLVRGPFDEDDVKLNSEVSNSDITKDLNANGHVISKTLSVVTDEEVLPSPISGKLLVLDNADELNKGGSDRVDTRDLDESERQTHVQETSSAPVVEDQNLIAAHLVGSDRKSGCLGPRDENKEVLGNRACISPRKELSGYSVEDVQKHVGLGESKPSDVEADGFDCSFMAEASSSSIAGEADLDSKMKFDLNEGIVCDDGKPVEPVNCTVPVNPSEIQLVNPPSAAASFSLSIPASVTVAAAAKGPFVPPEDLLRSKGELGWKGSAVTSAFRPAEPRKILQVQSSETCIYPSDASTSKPGRILLDFDLNEPDERGLDDLGSQDFAIETGPSFDLRSKLDVSRNELRDVGPVRSSGGLDLDLNISEELSDIGQYPTSVTRRAAPPIMPVKSLSTGGLPVSEVRRDFDLNNGPCVEDSIAEPASFNHQARGSIHTQPPVAGLRMGNPEIGNFSSWFPPVSYCSSVAIPSFLPDRGQQPFPIVQAGAPQRIFGPAGNPLFNPDVYRGSVLSSSTAVPFPSTPFQYPVYPFGTTFPLPSATFSVGSTKFIGSSAAGRFFNPPVNLQLLGPVDALSSHCPRPYVVSLPESSAVSSSENNRKWGRQGLDLNAGPGALDVEGKEEMLPVAPNQPSVSSSQSQAEDQARMYPVQGGVSKRKEPDGGRESESLRFKQSSCQ